MSDPWQMRRASALTKLAVAVAVVGVAVVGAAVTARPGDEPQAPPTSSPASAGGREGAPAAAEVQPSAPAPKPPKPLREMSLAEVDAEVTRLGRFRSDMAEVHARNMASTFQVHGDVTSIEDGWINVVGMAFPNDGDHSRPGTLVKATAFVVRDPDRRVLAASGGATYIAKHAAYEGRVEGRNAFGQPVHLPTYRPAANVAAGGRLLGEIEQKLAEAEVRRRELRAADERRVAVEDARARLAAAPSVGAAPAPVQARQQAVGVAVGGVKPDAANRSTTFTAPGTSAGTAVVAAKPGATAPQVADSADPAPARASPAPAPASRPSRPRIPRLAALGDEQLLAERRRLERSRDLARRNIEDPVEGTDKAAELERLAAVEAKLADVEAEVAARANNHLAPECLP